MKQCETNIYVAQRKCKKSLLNNYDSKKISIFAIVYFELSKYNKTINKFIKIYSIKNLLAELI